MGPTAELGPRSSNPTVIRLSLGPSLPADSLRRYLGSWENRKQTPHVDREDDCVDVPLICLVLERQKQSEANGIRVLPIPLKRRPPVQARLCRSAQHSLSSSDERTVIGGAVGRKGSEKWRGFLVNTFSP